MAQLRSGTRSTSINQLLRYCSNIVIVVTLGCVHDGLHSTQLSARFFSFLKRKKIRYMDAHYVLPWMVQLLSSVLMGSSCVFFRFSFIVSRNQLFSACISFLARQQSLNRCVLEDITYYSYMLTVAVDCGMCVRKSSGDQ